MSAANEARAVRRRPAIAYPLFTARLERNLVVAIVLFATAQALLWSLVRLPGDGGPDEGSHVNVLFAMRAQGGFPRFEGYAPGAFAGGPVRAQVAYELTPNIFAVPVAATLALLGSSDYAFNVHVARLFNVALLPLTLWLAYLTLRRLFPPGQLERIWGLAFMSAIPMFVLAFAFVTNDSPTIAASTLAVYATIRAWQEDYRPQDAVLLGLALGLVALHKYNGFLILPGTGALMIARLWRTPRRLLGVGGVMALLAVAMAGWWYVRAQAMYGDPLGIATTQRAVDATGGAPIPPRARGLSLPQFVQDVNWIGENFATFWAGYGLQKLKMPAAAYLAVSALVAVAGLGLALRVARGAARRSLSGPLAVPGVLMGFLFGGLLALSFWSSYTVDVALNGRYAYPGMLPFVGLTVLGLTAWRRWRGLAGAAVTLTIPVMLAGDLAYYLHILVPDVVAFGV